MAYNQYSNFSPEVNNYLSSYQAVPAASYSWAADPGFNAVNNLLNQASAQGQRRDNIEWANRQRMSDPNYWAQAFGSGSSGGGQNSLTDLSQNIDQSPAYKWRYQQGMEAVNRTAAAKRMLGSGNRLAELIGYGQGMASQEYGAEADRQLRMRELASRERLANAQMAMQGMEASRKYGPPQTFNFPGGMVTRY